MGELWVEERADTGVICPHCDKELEFLIARKLSASFLSRRLVYACPNCRKVLGVSHRKGLLAS